MPTLFARILPFFFLGLMLVFFLLGIIVLSYLWVLAALIGILFFIVAKIKARFAPKTTQTYTRQPPSSNPPSSGRIIEHDDTP